MTITRIDTGTGIRLRAGTLARPAARPAAQAWAVLASEGPAASAARKRGRRIALPSAELREAVNTWAPAEQALPLSA